ncbi:hypothetical protein GF336_04130 [Candidatus Woesearchaeota archaeon]|nr:hypothetical protein [Candidatus Woesearchaeota archaeon]
MKINDISPKCLHFQEEFLKDNILVQVRYVMDKRNLKFNPSGESFTCSS